MLMKLLKDYGLEIVYHLRIGYFLNSKNIKVVINCTKNLKSHFVDELTYYRVKVHDNLKIEEIENLSTALPIIVPIINKKRDEEGKIF